MNLNQLRFAAAVAAHGSFSRAARHCHVTQPSLSNGIALLEEELGAPLFLRTTRAVALSAFGAQMLPRIEAVLAAQAELTTAVEAFHDPAHKVVRVGLSPLVDLRRVTQVLEPYRREWPATECFFKECFLDDLETRLRNGQIDLLLRPRLANARPRRSQSRVAFYEEALFYLARDPGPVAGSAPGWAEARSAGGVPLQSVAAEIFVLGPGGCGLAATTRGLFAAEGCTLREYGGEALSFQVMQEWADIGIGATILPASKLVAPYAAQARPLLLSSDAPARVVFEAVWLRQGAYPEHVVALHRHFRERVPRLVQGLAA